MKVNGGWVLRLAVAGFVLSGWRAVAADYSWVGGGADTFWRTAENWQGGVGFPGAAGDGATVNAADTVRLNTNCVLTIGKLALTASTPKTVRIEAEPGAAFAFSGIAAPNGGIQMGGHADNRLIIAPDVVIPSRTDRMGGGVVVFEGAVTSTVASGYALIFGAGTSVFSDDASLAIPFATVGLGNAGYQAVVTLTNQTAWSVARVELGVSSAATTRGTLVQDSEESAVAAGDVRLGVVNSANNTNAWYLLRKGSLTATEVVIGVNSPGRFENEQGELRSDKVHVQKGVFYQEGGSSEIGALSVGNTNLTAAVALAGGTLLVKSDVSSLWMPEWQTFAFSGGVLRATNSLSCQIPMSLRGSVTFDTPVVGQGLTLRRGFSGRAEVVKTGAGGLGLGSMPQAFLSGSLIISNGYVNLPSNFELSSFEGSEEPLAVKVCDGAILRLQDITTVVSVPLDLEIEGSGKIDFPYAGSSYNRGLVAARTLATNGVALPPGRYTTAHGFVTGGSTACSVVVPVTWTGAGDGEAWHDPANWAGGSVPNGTTAVADLSNARGDVRLDSPVTLTCLVYNPQGAQRGLTFTGNGALTLHVPVIVSPCLFVGPGRTLTLDVPFSRTPDGGSLAITGGGSIQVNKGFPGIGGGQGASFSLNGQLVFSGNVQMGNTFLGLWRHELNGQTTVVFTNGCQLTCQRILNNPSGFYALNQVLHDGGTVTCGDVFFTRHNGNSVSPYTYFMRSGTLTTTNANGISLGVHYTSAWTRYSGGSFVMSGGTVNTARFAMGMPDNMIDLNGGEVNLGSGGIISTTNIQGTVRLGGVALCAAANWSSSLNMELSGENGPTVLDTQGRTVTLSGALSGLGGLVKTGSGTLTLSGATNTFAGPLVVSGGTLVCGATSVFNGVTDLVVTNGTLNVDGDVLSSGMTVRVGGTGALLVAAGKELVVERLYLNNTLRPAGSYTFGEGTVTVFPYAGIVWTGGAHDGALWSTLGNWANTASVPNGSDVQLDLGFSQFEASDQIVLDVTPGVALAGLTFDQGAPGCTLTVTCPGAVTNTLTFAADGTVCVAEGQTLVLDTDVFMNGHLFKTGLGTLVLDRNVASASAAGDFRLYIREGRVVNRGALSKMAVQPANALRHVPSPEYVMEGPRAVMQNRVFALPGYWTGINAERGVFVQRGGLVDLTTPSVAFNNAGVGFMIAGGSGTEGRYVLEGGELITCPTWPAYVSGNYARGVFCQSGGTSMFYRLTLSMPVTTGGFGEVLLSNGTLRVNGTVTKGNSGGRVELSGGRVEVLSDGAVFAEDVPVTLATGVSGAVAFAQATTSLSNTLSGTLSGSGCLIQEGPGALLMNGVNGFSGSLAVQGGVLQVTSPLQGVTDVWADGGVLELLAPVPSLTNLAVRAAGATVVFGGTAAPFPSGMTLNLAEGVVTELDFEGVVDVDRLVLGDQPKSPGLYGGAESPAPLKPSSAYFSGTGALNVLYGPAHSGTILSIR